MMNVRHLPRTTSILSPEKTSPQQESCVMDHSLTWVTTGKDMFVESPDPPPLDKREQIGIPVLVVKVPKPEEETKLLRSSL